MRSRVSVGCVTLPINMLELVGMVWTAYVMIVIKKDIRRREEGEAVLMRGDNSSAVQGCCTARGQG